MRNDAYIKNEVGIKKNPYIEKDAGIEKNTCIEKDAYIEKDICIEKYTCIEKDSQIKTDAYTEKESDSNKKTIKLKQGYVMRKIADSDIVIPIGNNIADFNGLITLNESAAFLFKLLSEGSSIPDMVNALISKYNINRELAGDDVDSFVALLKKEEMLMDM